MAQIKCPDCGKEQEDTNKFCKNCGANLSNVKAEEVKLDLDTAPTEKKADLSTSTNNEAKIDLNTSPTEEKADLKTAQTEENIDAKASEVKETPKAAVGNKKICSKCGHELKNEKFCPRCGQSTASIVPYEAKTESQAENKDKTCPSCGTKVSTEKFCPNCGSKIGEEKPAQTQNVPQKYCRNCGNPIDPKAEICPKCGVRQVAAQKKEPLFSLVLSLIFPGLGQFYNNQSSKGIYLIIGAIVSIVLSIFIIGFLLYMFVWLYGMYDAYSTAIALNNGEYVEDKLF